MGKKKREEERRILAEFDEALQKERAEREEEHEEEKVFHCSRCKTEMKKGVCPTCGHTMYVGMSEKERKKIRRIVWIVGLVIFALLFVVINLK